MSGASRFSTWSFALPLLLLAFQIPAARAKIRVTRTSLPRGTHWRIAAPSGAIHVFRPAGYRHRTAGIVLHVHGFNTTVDSTWKKDGLPRQFAESRRNAIFIAVAGPRSLMGHPRYPSLGEVMRLVSRHLRISLPPGPVVAMGHSAGYWTIVSWLDHPRLGQVILLDGMYGFAAEYRRWITTSKKNRIIFVARGTRRLSRKLVRGLKDVAFRKKIPTRSEAFTSRERSARVVHIGSQYRHASIVRCGKVIPSVLRLTRLSSLQERISK